MARAFVPILSMAFLVAIPGNDAVSGNPGSSALESHFLDIASDRETDAWNGASLRFDRASGVLSGERWHAIGGHVALSNSPHGLAGLKTSYARLGDHEAARIGGGLGARMGDATIFGLLGHHMGELEEFPYAGMSLGLSVARTLRLGVVSEVSASTNMRLNIGTTLEPDGPGSRRWSLFVVGRNDVDGGARILGGFRLRFGQGERTRENDLLDDLPNSASLTLNGILAERSGDVVSDSDVEDSEANSPGSGTLGDIQLPSLPERARSGAADPRAPVVLPGRRDRSRLTSSRRPG